MELKDRLRELRGNRTQKEMAEQLGTKPNNYNNWENGRGMDLQMLQHIADFHGVTTDYLLGRTDYKNPELNQLCEEFHFSEYAIKALRQIKESPEEFEALQFLLERDLILSENEGANPDDEYLIYSMAIGVPPQNPDLKYIDDFSHFRIRGLRTILKYFSYDPESFVSYFHADHNGKPADIKSFTKSRTAEYFLTRIMNFNKYLFWTSTHRLEKKKQNKTNNTDI